MEVCLRKPSNGGSGSVTMKMMEVVMTEQIIANGYFSVPAGNGLQVESVTIQANGVFLRNSCNGSIATPDYSVTVNGLVTLLAIDDFEVGDSLIIQWLIGGI